MHRTARLSKPRCGPLRVVMQSLPITSCPYRNRKTSIQKHADLFCAELKFVGGYYTDKVVLVRLWFFYSPAFERVNARHYIL
jgi:hypothetical protein